MMKTVAGIFLTFFVITLGNELPRSFKICRQNDPNLSECVNEAAALAIQLMGPGIKSLRLLPIEPLAVDRVTIGENGGAVALKQEYRNIKLHGLTKGLRVSDYKLDFENLIFDSVSFNPQVDFVADYAINGKILLLPIRGHGKSNITMLNLRTQNTYYGEKYERDGEIYMRIKKYDVKFTPERVLLNFDNLFDGDTILGSQMNNFLNQNADLLFKELQAPYEETFGLVFTKIANDVFSQIPFRTIFPES